MALTLTFSILVALTVPMLGLLSASALEPLIARNLVDTTRALYVAEAGIEWAFTLLVDTPDTEVAFPGAASDPAGTQAIHLAPPSGLLPWGTTSIIARRDAGVPVAADDVVITSTGTVNGAQRTVEVTIRRAPTSLPGDPGGPGTPGQHRIVNWRER